MPDETSAEEVIGQKLKVFYGMAVSDGAWFVEALNDAGWQLVPPDEGWRIVKLTRPMQTNGPGSAGWFVTEELR